MPELNLGRGLLQDALEPLERQPLALNTFLK